MWEGFLPVGIMVILAIDVETENETIFVGGSVLVTGGFVIVTVPLGKGLDVGSSVATVSVEHGFP